MASTPPGNGSRSSATNESPSRLNVEAAVKERYSSASQAAEPSLCCSVDYDRRYLEVLPQELIDRDYGCGDPSKFVREGETVLDLGSGGGKVCYIASQVVGPSGRVIGVDMNDDMLSLARRFEPQIGRAIGHHNVEFHKARIQDLGLDLDIWESYLQANPITGTDAWLAAQQEAERLRRDEPLIAGDSIDVVVSNCVLNLVTPSDRRQLFAELFRVLRRGGRVAISDIVSDEPVPQRLQQDPRLWSGCISGAFVEDAFLRAFEEAGFYGIEILERQEAPWAVVEGIEFRSVTVQAFKGKEGPCLDRRQAVVYRGPWKSVTDDDGHLLRRGERTAVCDKTYTIYSRAPYAEEVIPIPPDVDVPLEEAQPMTCGPQIRSPRETKQRRGPDLLPTEACCGPDDCC